jgi:hypothetical protein
MHAPQVEKVGKEVTQPYTLNECLQVAFDRSSIFFRKVEIRKTDDMEQMLLMSTLAEMWAGKRPFGPAADEEAGGPPAAASSGGGGGPRKGRRRGRPRKVGVRAAGGFFCMSCMRGRPPTRSR